MSTGSSADEATLALSQNSPPLAADALLSPGTAMKQPLQADLGEALRQRQAALAEELVHRQYLAHPELVERYGPAGRDKCLKDAHYHLAYLADAMDARDPDLFAHYIAWAKVMLGTRGIPTEELRRHLEVTQVVVQDMLAGEAGALARDYIGSSLARISSMPTNIPSYLEPTAPHAKLARAYLDALLNGERQLASQDILHAVGTDVTAKDIYLHVFQPVQYEVGRLWQLNEISVAQEHYCTAATQLIMSQLYPYVFGTEKRAGNLVFTCVAGDLHEIGLRMVSDFFEMDGWNTFYLGANMPPRSVVETVIQRKAEMLCISATLSSHVKTAVELIQMVRAEAACRDVSVLVGGYPFQVAPDLWRTTNSDGCAANAQEAIILANQLMAQKGRRGSA